nr:hypothetical protein Iba_chr03dCG10720 [Ipomoea batatas]
MQNPIHKMQQRLNTDVIDRVIMEREKGIEEIGNGGERTNRGKARALSPNGAVMADDCGGGEVVSLNVAHQLLVHALKPALCRFEILADRNCSLVPEMNTGFISRARTLLYSRRVSCITGAFASLIHASKEIGESGLVDIKHPNVLAVVHKFHGGRVPDGGGGHGGAVVAPPAQAVQVRDVAPRPPAAVPPARPGAVAEEVIV